MKFRRSLLNAVGSVLLAALGAPGRAANSPASSDPTAGGAQARIEAEAQALARADIERAVDAVYPALVRLQVVVEEGEEGRMQKRRVTGSGTIISKDGYILTNHHVAGRATRITVRLANREELDAELVGSDALSDLAVLKIDPAARRDPGAPLPFARFGDSDKLKIGDVVLAMGCPAGLSQSVTKGVVANTTMIAPGGSGGLVLDGEMVGELVRWIGHDAVIYPGNSGGPLVNLDGEIVGVNEIGIGSLGGAIPSNLARGVARELIAKGRVWRSWIGLEVQPLLKEMTNAHGILVADVLPDSPAQDAGLQPGDLVTVYDGRPVTDTRAPEEVPLFNRLVLATPVGVPVTLRGVRDGQPMRWRLVTVTREPKRAREVEFKSWGLTVRDFTRVSALENQRTNLVGVLVDTVRPGGPCAECKPPLRRDDIITKAGGVEILNVKKMGELTRQLTQSATEPKPVLITFERDAQEFVTVAQIGPEPQDEKPARPAKAWLGVQTQVLTSELARALGLEGRKGVRVTEVLPDSPAAQAGVKVGDVFLKLDGQVIAASTPSDQELFENLVRAYKVGGTAELEGVREGQPLKLTATLGRQPKSSAELPEYKDDRFEFTARAMSLSDRVEERMALNANGLRISTVQNGGWAALAGLSSGDILLALDGQPVTTIGAFRETLLQFRETKPRRVVCFVKRGIHTFFSEIEPKW